MYLDHYIYNVIVDMVELKPAMLFLFFCFQFVYLCFVLPDFLWVN